MSWRVLKMRLQRQLELAKFLGDNQTWSLVATNLPRPPVSRLSLFRLEDKFSDLALAASSASQRASPRAHPESSGDHRGTVDAQLFAAPSRGEARDGTASERSSRTQEPQGGLHGDAESVFLGWSNAAMGSCPNR